MIARQTELRAETERSRGNGLISSLLALTSPARIWYYGWMAHPLRCTCGVRSQMTTGMFGPGRAFKVNFKLRSAMARLLDVCASWKRRAKKSWKARTVVSGGARPSGSC